MINLLKAKIDDFLQNSFLKFDENLDNLNKSTISIEKNKSLDKFGVGIHSDTITRNLVCDEIIQNITKEFKVLLINSKIEYLDYSYLESNDIDFLPPKETGEILANVVEFESRNVICGTLTSTLFMDCSDFVVDSERIKKNNVYKVGHIKNTNIIIDAYIRYNDHSIYLFDNVSFNIIFDDIFEDENIIKVYYRLSILVENPKYIKVLLNTNSTDYSTYNLSKRKDKLNKI